MEIKTYPMKVAEGKVYTEITLRDVVERCDVSDLPMLAEIKRLYDENAKLREERREYQATIDSLVNECDDHKTENDKLRKLVKRMHRHIKQTCDVCDEYYCSSWDEDNECCVFDVLARELGVDDV